MVDMMDMDGGGWDDDMFDDIAGDVPDKIKRVTFLVDRSGSMDGTILGTINTIMEEVLPELDEHSVRISVAEFDETVEWKTSEPSLISQFGAWERVRSESYSKLGVLFSELADKMSSPAWTKESGKKGSADYIILFSDGLSTDDFRPALKKLANVNTFQTAKRMAVSFSDISYEKLLNYFAGDAKNVINATGSGSIDTVENAILRLIK